MSANARRCLTIVLAAGEGVRMRSARPKVLHELAGRSMLAHTLSTVLKGAMGDIVVVVGPDADGVAAEALKGCAGGENRHPASSGGAPPTRSWRRAIRLSAVMTTFSSSTLTFR